jgi:hypothetical protein
LNDTPTVIPTSGWEYANDGAIRLLPCWHAVQTERDLRVHYAARDDRSGHWLCGNARLLSFLRNATSDDFGNLTRWPAM